MIISSKFFCVGSHLYTFSVRCHFQHVCLILVSTNKHIENWILNHEHPLQTSSKAHKIQSCDKYCSFSVVFPHSEVVKTLKTGLEVHRLIPCHSPLAPPTALTGERSARHEEGSRRCLSPGGGGGGGGVGGVFWGSKSSFRSVVIKGVCGWRLQFSAGVKRVAAERSYVDGWSRALWSGYQTTMSLNPSNGIRLILHSAVT